MKSKGWGIPFPRVKARPSEGRKSTEPRTDEELEALQREWVANYQLRLQAFRLLGLSVGTPADEVNARYQRLVQTMPPDSEARQTLDRAYSLVATNDETGSRTPGDGSQNGSGPEGGSGTSRSRRHRQRGQRQQQAAKLTEKSARPESLPGEQRQEPPTNEE